MPEQKISEQKMPVQLRALIQQRDGLAQAVTQLEFQNAALAIELQDLREELAASKQELAASKQELAALKQEPAEFREAAE